MTTPIRLLDIVQVATPCTASWDRMSGDERMRHCTDCNRTVYNLSELTRFEAEAFLENAEGRQCIRLYRRADGSVMTKDCPNAGEKRIRRYKRITGVMAAGLALISDVASLTPDRWATAREDLSDALEYVSLEIEETYTPGKPAVEHDGGFIVGLLAPLPPTFKMPEYRSGKREMVRGGNPVPAPDSIFEPEHDSYYIIDDGDSQSKPKAARGSVVRAPRLEEPLAPVTCEIEIPVDSSAIEHPTLPPVQEWPELP